VAQLGKHLDLHWQCGVGGARHARFGHSAGVDRSDCARIASDAHFGLGQRFSILYVDIGAGGVFQFYANHHTQVGAERHRDRCVCVDANLVTTFGTVDTGIQRHLKDSA
jgi:hypothetical protein